MWKGIRDPRPHVEMQQYTVIREKFMTEKDEDELRKESMFTQTTLLFQQTEELITCNDIHRTEDEFFCKNCRGEVERGAGCRKW